MFKKLVAVIVLCLSIQSVMANEEYQDREYFIAINSSKIPVGEDQLIIESTYSVFATKTGAQLLTREISKSLGEDSTIRHTFQIPNKATYFLMVNKESVNVIAVVFISKELDMKVIVFASPKENNQNLTLFLSDTIAQRAFKKAGITLTKKQIDSMVEVK